MSELTDFLVGRYGEYGDDGQLIVDELERLWALFQPLADPEFVGEFCSGGESRFLERFSEMYLAGFLADQGMSLGSSDHGPDIRIESMDPPMFFEMVTPDVGQGVNRLPDEYVSPDFTDKKFHVGSVPHEAILLRWTSSIRQKWERLEEYKRDGIVGRNNPCVIAINSVRLGHNGFDGISQFPVAVESVYPIGPQQVHLNRETLEVIGHDLVYRPEVTNANSKPVQTDLFLDPAYSDISAILAFHKKPDHLVFDGGRDVIVVHNLNAGNPVPQGFLPSAEDFWFEPDGEMHRVRSNR